MITISDGTLPCLQKIPWLAEEGGIHFLSEYGFFMTATKDAHILLGPFYFRLYRCSASDVEQINYFYKKKQLSEYVPL